MKHRCLLQLEDLFRFCARSLLGPCRIVHRPRALLLTGLNGIRDWVTLDVGATCARARPWRASVTLPRRVAVCTIRVRHVRVRLTCTPRGVSPLTFTPRGVHHRPFTLRGVHRHVTRVHVHVRMTRRARVHVHVMRHPCVHVRVRFLTVHVHPQCHQSTPFTRMKHVHQQSQQRHQRFQ